MNIVELTNIQKAFKSGFLGRRRDVLRDLSLEVREGEVYGLLGHNGSGKTTTMRIMLGLLRADAGDVRLFGDHGCLTATRRRIGFLGDELGLYPSFSADEMLQMAGGLYGMDRKQVRSRREELLELVGLTEARKRRVRGYSKGMRQRLGIAVAILHDPELLVLDEPYSGLDPIGRRELRGLLLRLKAEGKTILISSHIVPDMEAVCDRVGILAEGSIRRCLELKDIFAQKSAPVEIIVSGVDARTFGDMPEPVNVIYSNADAVALRCMNRDRVKEVLSKVYAFGGEVLEIKPLRFDLEDYVMETMGSAAGADKIEVDKREVGHALH